MPTTVTKIVDTGGTGDYSSLAAWEAARQGNLISSDTIEKALCKCTKGAADTGGQLLFSGWTVDGTRYPMVYVDEEYRHKGVWDDTKYRLVLSNVSGLACIASMIYAYSIQGMQVKNNAETGKSSWCVWHNPGTSSASVVTLYNNIFRSASTAVGYNGGVDIISSTAGSYFYLYNNLFYDFQGEGYTSFGFRLQAPGYYYIYNNTAYNCTFGYVCSSSSIASLYNNIATGCYDGFYGVWSDADYNVSDISGDVGGTHSKIGTPKYVSALASPRNLDLHINDTVARNSGYAILSYDIRGYTRPYPSGGSHDIGCFEHTPIKITVAESAHSHSVDQVSFTQLHVMVIQETGHQHTVDGNLSFTQLHIMAVQDCLHAHTAENCDADVSIQLYVDDAFHSQSADGGLVFDLFYNMVIQDALQAHRADHFWFTQLHIFVVQDGTQAHSAENCDANTRVNIVVQEASHGHTLDEDLVFTQEHNIVVQDAYMQITSTHGWFLGSQIRVVTSSTGMRTIIFVDDGRKVVDTTPVRTVSLAE
jgi:hypothetical protein